MTRAEAIAEVRRLAAARAEIESADLERNHRVWLAAQALGRRELVAAIAIGSDEPAADALAELETAVADYRQAVADGGAT